MQRINPTPMALPGRGMLGVDIGKYGMLFGGHLGYDVNNLTDARGVQAIDSTFQQYRTTNMSEAVRNSMVSKVGKYAVLAGGWARISGSLTPINRVEVYDDTLQKVTSPESLRIGRYNGGGANIGLYAVFAGGQAASAVSNQVDAYDSALQRITALTLGAARSDVRGISTRDYAIFAGGNGLSGDYVDAYSETLERRTLTANHRLWTGQSYPNGGEIGDYIIIGGSDRNTGGHIVTVYNRALQRQSIRLYLIEARGLMGTAVAGNAFLIFFGGYNSSDSQTVLTLGRILDVFDAQLNHKASQ